MSRKSNGQSEWYRNKNERGGKTFYQSQSLKNEFLSFIVKETWIRQLLFCKWNGKLIRLLILKISEAIFSQL